VPWKVDAIDEASLGSVRANGAVRGRRNPAHRVTGCHIAPHSDVMMRQLRWGRSASAPVELYVTSTCIASKITTPRCGRCIFFAAHRIALCEALLLDRVSLAFLG